MSKLLRRVEERQAAEMATDVRRLRARCIAQYQHVYNKAMQAFERSTARINQRRQRKIVGLGHGESTVAELVTEEGVGDPRHLEVARRAVDDICKLAGLDTMPIAELPKAEDLSQLTTEELEVRLRRTMAALTPAPPLPGLEGTAEKPKPSEMTPEEQAYAEVLAHRERAKRGDS